MKVIIKTITALLPILLTLITCGCGETGLSRHAASKEDAAMAETAMAEGNYIRALKHYQEFLRKNENVELTDESATMLVSAYIHLGGIHLSFKDYQTAIDYYRKGCVLSDKMKLENLQLVCLSNLAATLIERGGNNDVTEAETIIRKMEQMPLKDKDRFYCLHHKGAIAVAAGDYDKAEDYMQKSLVLIDSCGLPGTLRTFPYGALSTCYEKSGDIEKAILYRRLVDSINANADLRLRPYLQMDSYRNLMRLFTLDGDMPEAVEAQERYLQLSDSLMSISEFLNLKNDQSEYTTRKANDHIERLLGTVSRQQMVMIGLIIVICLVVTATIVIWRQKMALKASHAALFRNNKELVDYEKNHLLENQDCNEVSTENHDPEDGVSTTSQHDEALWDKIINFVRTSDEIFSSDFSLASLAKQVDSNTKYVSTVINERTGANFRNLINEQRIVEARKRLTDEEWQNMTIEAVGNSVGFQSKTTFFNSFKAFTGLSPAYYRKMVLSERAEKRGFSSDS